MESILLEDALSSWKFGVVAMIAIPVLAFAIRRDVASLVRKLSTSVGPRYDGLRMQGNEFDDCPIMNPEKSSQAPTDLSAFAVSESEATPAS